jgi:hypothetical protein
MLNNDQMDQYNREKIVSCSVLFEKMQALDVLISMFETFQFAFINCMNEKNFQTSIANWKLHLLIEILTIDYKKEYP